MGQQPGCALAREPPGPEAAICARLDDRAGDAFIEKRRDDSRPFFLYFPTTLPHWSEFPKRTAESHAIPSDAPYSDRDWPQVEKNYAAMVTRLDRDVGQILGKLDEMGLTRNTLFLFTSDNGPSAETIHNPEFFRSAGPLRGSKRTLYEGGIRVPLIAHWPAVISGGGVNHTVAAFWDILPTLGELAGVAVPSQIDGLSFAPVLRGGGREREHEFLYWDYGHARAAFMQAVRAGSWKAVRNSLARPIELYDLATDPGESRNLAGQNPAVVERMVALMRRAFVPTPDFPINSATNTLKP